ncbi:MAG: hypothetical protein QOF53_160 [Nocardioidaceae bacterium]|nr:hypothetical protein [Nocardioidaceae bacterium]
MRRNGLLVLATALAAGLLGPVGIAAAENSTTPSPAAPAKPAAPSPAAPSSSPANQPPVAVDDTGITVAAGRSVTVKVLANDTDDGDATGAPTHLQVATFDNPDGRVSTDAAKTVLVVATQASDAGTTLRIGYTATDGSLQSNTAHAVVTVTAAPKPPATRKVSLRTAARLVTLRKYHLSGSVRPLAPGPATVSVQQRVGTTWQTRAKRRVDGHGRYTVPFSANRPTRYVFRAVSTWRNGRKAVSHHLTRTVVAGADARVSGPLSRKSVPYSYRAGCPVGPSGLRKVTINRFTYRHVVARGSLIVRASAVPDILRVFRAAFAERFPIRSMRPTDNYYAHGRRTPTQSDVAAMRADNTSAFNCRPVTGNPYRVSQHSYGNAIDINTVRNPYVVGRRVYPSFAKTYLNRSEVRTGMITRSGVIATMMRRNGWPWGARWSDPDYQHFSSNGG